MPPHSPKRTRRRRSSLETRLARKGLRWLAILFFLAGAAWFLVKGDLLQSIIDTIEKLMTSSDKEEETKVVAQGNIPLILLSLLPGLALTVYAWFSKRYREEKNRFTVPAFYAGAGLLYIAYLFDVYHFPSLSAPITFPSLELGSLVTVLVAAPVVWVTRILHKPWVHIGTMAFLYLSAVLLSGHYSGADFAASVMIGIFSIGLYYVTSERSGWWVNAMNAIFALIYFGLYFLRKLILKDEPQFVWVYAVTAGGLFSLLVLINTLKPYTGDKRFGRWFTDGILLAVTLFSFITVWYALRKYDLAGYQWLIALLFTLMGLILVWINQAFQPGNVRPVLYVAVILLASAILPLVVREGWPVLYGGIAGGLMILYSRYGKNQNAALAAVVAVSVAAIILMVKLVLADYPIVFGKSDQVPLHAFLISLYGGLAVALASYLVRHHFPAIDFMYKGSWFSKKATRRYLVLLHFSALYLILFWIVQFGFQSAYGVPELLPVSWFLFHMTFIWILDWLLIDKKSWVYRFLAIPYVISAIALPVAMNFFAIALRDVVFAPGGAGMGVFWVSFLALVPVVSLFWNVTTRIGHWLRRRPKSAGGLWLFRVGFLAYLLLAQWDHLSVILSGGSAPESIIGANRYVPYTVVLGLSSLVLLWLSFDKKIRLLRRFSLGVLAVTLLKFFALDFATLTATGQGIAFWMVGGVLLLYSFMYQRLRAAGKKQISKEETVASGGK